MARNNEIVSFHQTPEEGNKKSPISEWIDRAKILLIRNKNQREAARRELEAVKLRDALMKLIVLGARLSKQGITANGQPFIQGYEEWVGLVDQDTEYQFDHQLGVISEGMAFATLRDSWHKYLGAPQIKGHVWVRPGETTARRVIIVSGNSNGNAKFSYEVLPEMRSVLIWDDAMIEGIGSHGRRLLKYSEMSELTRILEDITQELISFAQKKGAHQPKLR